MADRINKKRRTLQGKWKWRKVSKTSVNISNKKSVSVINSLAVFYLREHADDSMPHFLPFGRLTPGPREMLGQGETHVIGGLVLTLLLFSIFTLSSRSRNRSFLTFSTPTATNQGSKATTQTSLLQEWCPGVKFDAEGGEEGPPLLLHFTLLRNSNSSSSSVQRPLYNCSIESAVRFSTLPWEVVVWTDLEVDKAALKHSLPMSSSRLHVCAVDVARVLERTGLQNWSEGEARAGSMFRAAEGSDALRLALLHSLGGMYLDLDILILGPAIFMPQQQSHVAIWTDGRHSGALNGAYLQAGAWVCACVRDRK
jgi:hypothetical protein